MNDRMAMQSALVLARKSESSSRGIAGRVYDGLLTGEQIVRTWQLDR